MSLPAIGGSQTVTVTLTNASDWSASSDATWLTATKTGATSLHLEAEVNRGNALSATVRCTSGTATATISVSQPALSATQSDSLALLDLYNATGGAGWVTRWTLTQRMSQWQGVKVENGRVTELHLPANNLSGTLPESIGVLSLLQYCDLHDNHLSGSVPETVSQWTQLVYLDLSENQLNGAFPAIQPLTKLIVLDGSFNTFSSLPALNSLTALEYLAFSKNSLTGSLPANWSSLTKLIYVDVSFNTFSSDIPSEWLSLTKLQAFYLYKNTLSGVIPNYLGACMDLKSLALDGNNLTGSIPANLGAQPALAEIWLAQNRLSGAIPASLSGNTHWNDWKTHVCPQQSGYGFDNCTGSDPAFVKSNLPDASRRQLYKEKYRRE
jgi:Leucine-rich repeat (LRR) protein